VNGFNSTTASNLPSDETGLNQTVSFSPQNEAILNGEYVSVNFNDAQASTVDYANNGEVVPPSGFEVENVAADTDANRFTVNLTATRDILPSENVSFNVTGISTEGQAGPLDVGFVRGDTGGSQTATFNVGGGGVPFSGVSATDVSKKQGPKSGPFTQTVSFTLGRKLTSGTTVTIDLSDAQAGASNGKNVDYSSADVTESSSMGGDITLSGAEIEYENTAAIASGTEIIIDISNVQTDSGEYGPFDVLFTRSDTTGSNSDSFEIK